MTRPFEEIDSPQPQSATSEGNSEPESFQCPNCRQSIDALSALNRKVIKLEQQVDHLQQLVITDSLTGLFNHRHFSQSLDQEMERTRRTGQPTALVLMDLDHFKQVNDEWGHEAGNRALQHIAKLIQNSTRKLDICCRYGGEEFVVILPSTDLLTGKQVAERLRALIENSPLDYQGQPIPLTISIGIDTYQADHNDSHEAFTHRVDALLYQAKQTGRNRVFSGAIHTPAATSVSRDEKNALLSGFYDAD